MNYSQQYSAQQNTQQQHYQYRFQYSLATYCNYQDLSSSTNIIQSQQNSTQTLQNFKFQQQRILRRSNQLITFKSFINSSTQTLIKTIFTHYIHLYTPLATRILKISQLIFPNLNLTQSTFISKCEQNLDLQRQKLVESIKSITQIFHNQKENYMKLMALIISSAVFKILTLDDEFYEIEFETVFHTVYWQLTGTHSTSQLLKKLLSETFNSFNFHHYLMNQEPPQVYYSSMAQSVNQHKDNVRRSMQIDSGYNVKKQLNYDQMNCSVRQADRFKDNKVLDKQGISFTKKLMKKQNINNYNKQNASNYLNHSKTTSSILKYNFNQIKQNSTVTLLKKDISQQQQPIEWQNMKSNQKEFNFKKDRITCFENFSKTKSNNKKPFAEYLSSNKKNSTFGSFLCQKKLKFQS